MSSDLTAWAAGVVMPSGRFYGRPLGEVIREDASYVGWVSRAWRDPAVKAAATVLIDHVGADLVGELADDLLAAAVAADRARNAA